MLKSRHASPEARFLSQDHQRELQVEFQTLAELVDVQRELKEEKKHKLGIRRIRVS